MSEILHKDLSYKLNGCIFDVHNEVGPGVREECYQKSMDLRLHHAAIPYIAKPATRRDLVYRGVVVDTFEPDLVANEQIIVELKHQAEGLARENFAQILAYQKFWQIELGCLVNFAMEKAIIQRVVYEPRHPPVEEDYDYIRDRIQPNHKPLLRTIRDSLVHLNDEIGLGYTTKTYRNMMIVELQHRGLACDAKVEVEALYDEVSARAVRTMQTHLRMTGSDVGLVAGFGKSRFMIRGVRS